MQNVYITRQETGARESERRLRIESPRVCGGGEGRAGGGGEGGEGERPRKYFV
jgi:hypothetical protein